MFAEVKDGEIVCYNAYDVKDVLKSYGFRFDPERKAWRSPHSREAEEVVRSLGFKVYVPEDKRLDPRLEKTLREMYPSALDHQILAAGLAVQKKSFLIGDEPGVGKTYTAIIYTDYLLYTGAISYAVVICPASIKHQWRSEFSKWVGSSVIVIDGDRQRRVRLFNLVSSGQFLPVFVVNFELLLSDDVLGTLLTLPENRFAVVIDEASRLKNRDSKTYKAVSRLCKRTEYKLALTGTPVENSLVEFFNIAKILRPSFMSVKEFEERHLEYFTLNLPNVPFPIKKIKRYKNLREFVYRISPFYIRRKKSDVRDMPDLIRYTREVPQSGLQKRLESFIISLAEKKSGAQALSTLTLLREVCDDPRLLLESDSPAALEVVESFGEEIRKTKDDPPKFEELDQILRTHPDSKILIFTDFARMAKRLAKKVGGLCVTGELPSSMKASRIGRFKSDPESRILVATDTMSYGVSLDEVDVVIHFDVPWSLGKVIQRTDRIYRVTSERTKYVYFLVSSGVEKRVWEVLSGKENLFKQVVDGEVLDKDIQQEILKAVFRRRRRA